MLHTSVTRSTMIGIVETDSPSVINLEVLRIDMGRSPSFRTIRSSILLMEAYAASEVAIPRPYSMYDCTGQAFTSSLNRIKRSIRKGYNMQGTYEEYILIGIYEHHISIDV